MSMTLRITEEQTEALRRQAAAEGRSMQAVAVSAICEYLDRRAHQLRVGSVTGRVLREEAAVFKRLRDA
jgi:predicted transcriptional regulator